MLTLLFVVNVIQIYLRAESLAIKLRRLCRDNRLQLSPELMILRMRSRVPADRSYRNGESTRTKCSSSCTRRKLPIGPPRCCPPPPARVTTTAHRVVCRLWRCASSSDTRPVVRQRYRAAQMALWLDLIPKLHQPDGDPRLDIDPCRHALHDDDDDDDDVVESSLSLIHI